MGLIQVGLVDTTTGGVDASLMAETSRALTIQAMRDFGPVWGVQASVSVLPDPTKIPLDVWPIFLVDSLPDGEGGFHSDDTDQPYSRVIATASDETWTLDASHELLEMLADPQGSRMEVGPAIAVNNGKIVGASGSMKYLVEVCDPVEAESCSYSINGIMVSDFILPSFYDTVKTEGKAYSFKHWATHPMEVCPGGYISWADATGMWWQIMYVDPTAAPYVHQLGMLGDARLKGDFTSLRNWIDGKTPRVRHPVQGQRKQNAHIRTTLMQSAADRRHGFAA